LDQARIHCSQGASEWKWASYTPKTRDANKPDIVLACAGDIVTMETLAAASILRQHAPDFAVKVVNVVDLMVLIVPDHHPHGMADRDFNALFTTDVDVCFQFHAYPGAIHSLVHGRSNPQRFHVRGYMENGTTTTPFLMTVLNQVSRYHIVKQVIRHAKYKPDGAEKLIHWCDEELNKAVIYAETYFQDVPAISSWRWTQTENIEIESKEDGAVQ